MTLIAGFKCSDGYVLCSDSQETKGNFRTNRQKMTPKLCGNVWLAIAGAGSNGEVIDAFAERLHENTLTANVTSLPALKRFIQRELLDFRKNEASEYSKTDRAMGLIIGASLIEPASCVVWKASASRLIEVEGFALEGHGDERYDDVPTRLYRKDLTTAEGIFLGLHLMSLAEQTSNYVKAPVTVVIVRPGGMHQENSETLAKLHQRVKLFEAQFDGLFLACPDTGLQPNAFGERLREFVRTVVHLRQEYIETSLHEHLALGLQASEIYNLIPAGMTIAVTPTTQETEALQRMQQETVKALRDNYAYVQEYPRILSNLAAMEKCHMAQLTHMQGGADAPDDEIRRAALLGSGEVLQAALMGPHKISEKAVLMLNRVRSYEITDQGFGQVVQTQLLVFSIKQAIETIQTESTAQAPVPASPSQS